MLVSKIKNKLPKKFYESLEFNKFRPSQEKAINAGLLEGKNMLVCSPTASGKTFVAELAGIKRILEDGGKMVYIVPLKSLASEKADEFKEKYTDFGIQTALSIGDPDSSEGWLSKYDIIVCTSEKFDSLLRHNIPWLKDVQTVIFDEIHLLNDTNRGPTLEIIITLLKRVLTNVQIIGLSATIGNPEEFADWLDAELIEDKWRPVELHQGIFHEDKLKFLKFKDDKPISKTVSDSALNVAMDTINLGKQALVFCPTKKSAEATAEKIADLINEKFNDDLSSKIMGSAGSATRQCIRLSKCVTAGTAFHHSGLLSKQKKLVENGFKDNKIKIICCTPTLAMGVNLPAFRVIMKSLKRFTGRGMDWIPVLEYHQMTGRAGRPDFGDDFGEAITLAGTEKEFKFIKEKYVEGDSEEITSKLSVEPVLRSAVLSLVASGFVIKLDELIEFFKETFYGQQFGDDFGFRLKIEDAVSSLIDFGFMKQTDNTILPTKIGRRVSELYIYPDAAHDLIEGLNKMNTDFDNIAILHLIASNWEMYPWTNIQKKDYEWIETSVEEIMDKIVAEPPNKWDWTYTAFLKKCKTCFLMNEWIHESNEEFILDEYNVPPGELRNVISRADWLLYGASELCKLTDNLAKVNQINKIKLRVKNGIKSELIPLVRLRGIGRVRARRLYSAGFKNVLKLRTAKLDELSRIIGKAIAEKVKEQVGQKIIRES